MKVAVYIAYHGSDKGGVYTYSLALIKILLESKEVEKLYIIYSREQKADLELQFKKNTKISLIETSIKERFISKHLWNLSMALLTFKNVSAEIPSFIEKFSNFINPFNYLINRLKCDIIHVPFQFSPFYKVNKPVAITLHDLQEYHFPEFFTAQTRIDRAIRYKMAVDYARIIVSFPHVKADIEKYFHVKDLDSIKVCPILSSNWFKKKEGINAESLLKKFEISNRFLLYPAQTWKHKNHEILLQAFKLTLNQLSDIQLICTGEKNDYFPIIEKTIKELRLEESVKFLGLVSSDELAALYMKAHLVVIPTLYEAGSGPLFEAMNYGIPVICSTTTSLPDTIGDSRFTFNPLDPEEMANLMTEGILNEEFRKENIENSVVQLSKIANTDFSAPFTGAYKSIINDFRENLTK